MHDVTVTVIAFHGTGEGTAAGSVTGERAVDRARSPRSSRRPTPPPRPAAPAEDAAELRRRRRGRRLGRRRRRDLHRRLRRLRAGARRGVRPGRRRGPGALRLRRPRRHHDVPRLDHRAAAAARPADRPLRLHRQDRRPRPPAPGSAAPPATSPTSTPPRWTPSWPAGSAGRERRVDLQAGRYDTILPPTAVADLMIYAYWTASARDAHDGQSVFTKRGGGTRIGERLVRPAACSSTPTRRTRGSSPRRSSRASSSDEIESVFDNGLPLGAHRLDPRRRR